MKFVRPRIIVDACCACTRLTHDHVQPWDEGGGGGGGREGGGGIRPETMSTRHVDVVVDGTHSGGFVSFGKAHFVS